jgi:hypothetical protein
MFHCVYFWLKKDLSAADRATFEAELTALSKLPYPAQSHIGKPAAVELRPVVDLSFDFGVVTEFKTLADHDFYQKECQDHARFIRVCKPFWEKVVIYDFGA